MQILTPRTAEEVIDFCLNHISLGTYDKRFFTNLFISNVLPRKSITTNQLALFKKIVNKYHKQMSKHNFFAFELAELPWSVPIIESADEYTKAVIDIKDNLLIVRTPYKNSFVQEFRTAHLMKWNSDDKHYTSEFGINTLKKVLDIVERHYEERQYSDTIQNIINEMKQYQAVLNWTPELRRINGNFMIVSTNESLHNAIKDIPLNTEPATLALLTSYGVGIDKHLVIELYEHICETDDDKKRLIFSISSQATCERNEVHKLKDWLRDIKCDYVIFSSMYVTNRGMDDMEELISGFNVPYTILSPGKKSTATQDLMSRKYKMPVLLKFNSFSYRGLGSMFAGKVVEIVNSTPIDVQ